MSEQTWQDIASAPKDGTTIRLRQGDLAYAHAFWRHGQWQWIEYFFPARPTHWQHVPDRSASRG